MPVDVLMPVVTEEGEEGVVTGWFVDEGRPCDEGQLLAEVQAEKVSAEVHAPAAGFVVDRVAIGDPVHQGQPICRVVEEVPESLPVNPPVVTVKASPAAKRVARELGVRLEDVSGTGPEGRITEEDVRRFGGTEEGRALRSVIARNLRQSHAETVPVTLFTTVDLGAELPPMLTAKVVWAAAAALGEHPAMNGHRHGDAFVPSDLVNISVAVQTDEGLVAPVVHDAGSMTIDEIAETIADLASRARDKTLTAEDHHGGGFSVSNLGAWGVEGFTPVINLPQVGILGVGVAREAPIVRPDRTIGVGFQMTLSLTFDHAFIDGGPAAEFLRTVVRGLAG
jgi:pyruvate dehydrogenase E2 component (dihydrolipoamide acetyltransferase)